MKEPGERAGRRRQGASAAVVARPRIRAFAAAARLRVASLAMICGVCGTDGRVGRNSPPGFARGLAR